MTEWGVVSVIVVLVGLVAGFVRSAVNLTTSITTLTGSVNALKENLADLTVKNTASHARIWDKIGDHDDKIADHETRLSVIEDRKGIRE